MRFHLRRVLELRCTNLCSRIGPMFSPRPLPTMSSSCIHEAASGLQFIQLRITTKLAPQCVLSIVISRRPLDPLSPLLPDSGLECHPYRLDYSMLPNSSRFAQGSRQTFQQGYLSVSEPFTLLEYLLCSKVSGRPAHRGIRTLLKPARTQCFSYPQKSRF